jgi:hypothetical protein
MVISLATYMPGPSSPKNLKIEWNRACFFRELTEDQLQEAFDLGVRVAEAVKSGKVRPYESAAPETPG